MPSWTNVRASSSVGGAERVVAPSTADVFKDAHAVSLQLLALWERLIGLDLLTCGHLRATLVLLLVQMAGTLTPPVLFPGEAWVGLAVHKASNWRHRNVGVLWVHRGCR
jgi:hypothetical protein